VKQINAKTVLPDWQLTRRRRDARKEGGCDFGETPKFTRETRVLPETDGNSMQVVDFPHMRDGFLEKGLLGDGKIGLWREGDGY
jgi:hypothetical protein